jgi:hypothetical protein
MTQPTVQYSATTYSVDYDAGSITVTVIKTGQGAGKVGLNTHAGSALSGLDFTAVNEWLSWNATDVTPRKVKIPILNRGSFKGIRSFTLGLSGQSGLTVGFPANAIVDIEGTISIAPPPPPPPPPTNFVTTDAYGAVRYGNYIIGNNNWGGTPNQRLTAASKDAWGVTTSASSDVGYVRSYPSITRGWTQNGNMLIPLSTPGTNDWTTKCGMGIQVDKLTQAKVHWQFTAPTTPGWRWMGLQDIYFHKTPTPAYTEFPPKVDLMIDQALGDQAVNSSTYYALVAQMDHASEVTIGGNKYLIYVDDSGESAYHQSGGHTIHLFNTPTSFNPASGNTQWGTRDGLNDVGAIVKFFLQAAPKNDAGKILTFASGATVTSALITPDLYLTAINSGWEIDQGTEFATTAFSVTMQNEI